MDPLLGEFEEGLQPQKAQTFHPFMRRDPSNKGGFLGVNWTLRNGLKIELATGPS